MIGEPIVVAEHSPTVNSTFTPAEYLDAFQEPTGLNFLHAPATVTASPGPEGTVDYAIDFDHPSLDHRGFFALLAETAPYKPVPPVEDVRTDWKIHEVEQRHRKTGEDPVYHEWIAGVLKYHEKFGTAWTDFVDGSLPVFRRVLAHHGSYFYAGPDNVLVYSAEVNRSFTPLSQLSPRSVARAFASTHTPKRVEGLVDLLHAVQPEMDEETVLLALKKAVSYSAAYRRRQGSGKRAAQHVYEAAPLSKQTEYIRSMVLQLPEDTQIQIKDWIVRHASSTFVGPDGVEYVYSPANVNESLDEVLATATAVQSKNHDAVVVRSLDSEGRENWSILPGSVTPLRKPNRIQPQVAWRTQPNGERELLLGYEKSEDDPGLYKDRMLGFLSVAYLQPSLRENWQRTWPNPRGYRPQPISVAQIPTYVLLPNIKKDILNSSLIDVAELAIQYS